MRAPLLCLALAAGLALASCGGDHSPRRDLVLILAERAPAPASSPAFDRLTAGGLTFEGPLRAPGTELPEPAGLGLRIELFTGRFDSDHQDAVWSDLPALEEAARLSGRRALGFALPGGITQEAGFDEFQSRGTGLEACASPAKLTVRLRTAVDKLSAKYAAADLRRASLFVVIDLAQTAPENLEPVLAALDQLDLTDSADLALFFVAPDATPRLLLHGASLPKGRRQAPVDPRDLYPTLARLGRIPAPGILQGQSLVE
jgi:hypothetical protein